MTALGSMGMLMVGKGTDYCNCRIYKYQHRPSPTIFTLNLLEIVETPVLESFCIACLVLKGAWVSSTSEPSRVTVLHTAVIIQNVCARRD